MIDPAWQVALMRDPLVLVHGRNLVMIACMMDSSKVMPETVGAAGVR